MEVIQGTGVEVFLDTAQVAKGAVWSSAMAPGLWFGVVLQGNVVVDQSALGERRWCRGKSALFLADRSFESRHEALSDGPMSGVFMRIADDRIEDLLGEMPGWLTGLVEGVAVDTASAIAWQMLACRLDGGARRLYMTGKAMEMMAGALALAGERRQVADAGRRWSARDIERFHEARDILVRELSDPPAVPDLARRVGLNARKLGQGFADLFGQPVYAFVKGRRLDEARRLIEAGETSIASVAYRLGYQPAHFATEFRRRFGRSPTAFAGRAIPKD
ncbi:helix-turn-helix transcriptional regulator [Zavarzinia compransoris]|uniref:AraC family transcriptional regulator n=1 Tax=Zavarzinia compransoris TaxID=1264899 RepID=A0A317E0L1_9PROT|nr:AraC family transcriptional regulator [Zavarzinia compransoris]PWR19984.1 AraC family transcriptional regulator [Zavarzinia compransoris]TDP44901.1 AraC family transcriptional activator of pyochelin receptor [Zavarzinia compransoris]